MDNVKVGDEVQSYDVDGNVQDAVVTAVHPAKRKLEAHYWNFTTEEQADMRATVTIKHDTGEEETVSVSDLDPRDSEVEREFRNICDTALEEIEAKLSKASKYLNEAVELSEKHGVPFNSSISFLSQSYYPTTLQEKFEDINTEFVSELTQAYSEYGTDGGWEHSAVC